MIWYQYLCADENLVRKKDAVKRKIRRNIGTPGVYVIALSHHREDLLEIYPTAVLMQPGFPKDRLFVVGIAKGQESAYMLAGRIIFAIYRETGAFQVQQYILARQRERG